MMDDRAGISGDVTNEMSRLEPGVNRKALGLHALRGAIDTGTFTPEQNRAMGNLEELMSKGAQMQLAPRPNQAQFETVYAGKFSATEIRPGIHGKWEVRFTLIGGGDNLELACNEINEDMKSARNYPKEGFEVQLSGNNDLPRGQDIVMIYTAVISSSGGRLRGGIYPDSSHTALLESLGLGETNNDVHRLACGARRVKEGFPALRTEIGTASDSADLNEGMIVRTAQGARSGTVTTYFEGIGGYDWHVDFARSNIVSSGASSQK